MRDQRYFRLDASESKVKRPYAEGTALDDTDLALLGEVQSDARLSLAELGRRVGLSAPAVAERLQRLERDGVIRGYRAELDPAALGYGLSAVIRVRPAPRQLHKVADVAGGARRWSSATGSPARTAT